MNVAARLRPEKIGRSRAALAIERAEEFGRRIATGEVPDQAHLARQQGLTRARVTQIMGLLDLHPRIREHVKAGRDFVTLRRLVGLLTLPPREQLVQSARLMPGFRVRPPRTAKGRRVQTLVADHRRAPVNALGYLHVMFTVEDFDGTLTRLRKCGAELVGEVVQYQDAYRLCYIRGPEGLLIGLAQEIG